MKKIIKKPIALLLATLLVAGNFAGCQFLPTPNDNTNPTETQPTLNVVDYVGKTKLDMTSSTWKMEVTVKSYIDGDTTHFNVPTSISPDGILRARYLCVNTPESTGKIEPWGKKASNFTKEKLKNATSIIVESNDSKLNADSTGNRYLLWIWYRNSDNEDYRCLNIELVQEGLSIAGGTVAERYGDITTLALQQAKLQKLNAHSGKNDPDFYYGDAYEIDLKGLRTNIALYEDCKVAFEGVVTRNNANTVYVEAYDEETEMFYGMSVFYGYETGELLNILKVGNKVRVVGTVTYYETGGTWQVSGLSYREFKPKDPGNTLLVESGHTAANVLTSPELFNTGKVTLEVMNDLESEETTSKTFDYAALAMSTSIRMEGLYVNSIYTTNNGGDNDGAMTLTCSVNGQKITVRTIVLYDENGKMLTKNDFLNKTINVTGIVDYFGGEYQIKVFTTAEIEVQ